jgi:primase-polymerase (primpol)-like protein
VLCVPDDLTEVDQWVLWRTEARGGKPTKVPYAIESTRRASVVNSADWGEFDLACARHRDSPTEFNGVGFVFFKGDPFVGIDIDDCLDSGSVKDWARGIVDRFSDTYIEISPGQHGLKIWARGRIPCNVGGVRVGDGSIEMYDHARYFAVTGKPFRGAPLEIEDHAADLLVLHARLIGRDHEGGSWPLRPLAGGKIPHGQQHSTLVSIAGTLRARRICDQAILACLHAVNQYQCEKPGAPANIERIVRSTERWNRREK